MLSGVNDVAIDRDKLTSGAMPPLVGSSRTFSPNVLDRGKQGTENAASARGGPIMDRKRPGSLDAGEGATAGNSVQPRREERLSQVQSLSRQMDVQLAALGVPNDVRSQLSDHIQETSAAGATAEPLKGVADATARVAGARGSANPMEDSLRNVVDLMQGVGVDSHRIERVLVEVADALSSSR